METGAVHVGKAKSNVKIKMADQTCVELVKKTWKRMAWPRSLL